MAGQSAYLFWTDGNGTVRRTKVGSRPVTVGSGKMCVIALGDESAATVHAVVERDHQRHVVRRLSRTHSLSVNDAVVDEQPLEHGDRLTVGNSEVTYLAALAVPPQTLRLSCRREDADGEVQIEIPSTVTVIGRAEGDLLIHDRSVSRRHLEIENYGPGLRWIRDLDSTNGSELNGAPLERRVPLAVGDTVKAGRILIRFLEGGEPPSDLRDVPRQRDVVFDADRAMA